MGILDDMAKTTDEEIDKMKAKLETEKLEKDAAEARAKEQQDAEGAKDIEANRRQHAN